MTLELCRLCLDTSQLVYNIFEYNIPELSKIILQCTAVEILKDEEIPNCVCKNCIQTVTHFNLFRKRCQDSDNTLKKKYSDNTRIDYKIENKFIADKQSSEIKYESNTETTNDADSKNMRMRNFRTKLKGNEESLKINSSDSDDSACEYSSDDENISNYSDSNCNDFDYKPTNDSNFQLESNFTNTSLTPSSFPSNILSRKKKCKIKRMTNKSNHERNNIKHHLIYTQQDYAMLGGERKVRIYEIDDTMKEIIGHNIYTCEICSTEFESFFEYYDHQTIHNGELVFKCSKCSEVFSNRHDFVDHDARHKIPCKICDLEVLPKSMSAHLLIHTDIHKCSECGMRHTSNASLEKHINARHTGIKGFVCHVCGKQSSCQSSMNRHMAYHSNERPYKCKYCDFCAKSLNIVQVHTSRKHFAEKCVCEICAKLFKSQPSLIQHMKRIHTARKHVCDICGKAFIERYNLNRHLKKHAGQRLHECKICHKEFFTIRKLKEHMHSHRQGCVNCPKCGKEFFYKKYYTKHVLKCTKTDDNSIILSSNECIPLISNFKQVSSNM